MTATPQACWIPPARRGRRCGARTRAGAPCRNPSVRGRARCRMHGGAAGSGAPRGNRNALRHGFYGAKAKDRRRRLRALVEESEAALGHM